jgi:hypothetical protein
MRALAVLRRDGGRRVLLQTSVKGRANVHVSAHRSRYRFWLLLVVRYVKKTNENEYAGSIGIRSEREQPLSPDTYLRHCESSTELRGKKQGRKTITNTDSSHYIRLPRPRRPPPRHVLRQAGGPEGRGSWSDLEGGKTAEEGEAEEESEVERRRSRQGTKKQCDGGVGNGRRREWWSLYYRAAANRRARCTYTATPSKRMVLGEVWISSSLSSRSPVSARKWRLVLFFCPALSGSLVLRLALSFEVLFKILIPYPILAWEVVPLVLALVCRLLTVR